jgi:nuclease-like protein
MMEGVAGGYAESRYRRGLWSWRRRNWWRFARVAVPYAGGFTALAFWLDTRGTWWIAGFAVGAMVAGGMIVWLLPPQHVLRWGQGAEGERATAKAIRPLLKEGWTAWHDIPDGNGNIDHLLGGRAGAFLLETKFLSGTAAVEDGVLTVRYVDDPDETYRCTGLRGRVLARAASLSESLSAKTGARPWVQAVVVLWGEFPERVCEDDKLVYLHGSQLLGWLRSRPKRP